jgi:hypothetical protein
MDRHLVFILSTNYSGSHYASLMIGSHSLATHVGEVCHLRKQKVTKPICARCGDAESCELFRGIGPETIDRAFEILFSKLPPEKSLIVDNSKKVDWAARFLDRPGWRIKVVHLIRDPRALVRRWDVMYKTPRQVWKQRWRRMRREPAWFFRYLTVPKRRLWLYKWLAQNRYITELIRSRRPDSLLVTYEDLAADPSREVRRIMEWAGFEFEPEQVEYWRVDHHGSQKTDYEWVKTEKRRFSDARWKEYLSPREQAAFAADPHVLRYLAEIGVRITPDGLTLRKDAAPVSLPGGSPGWAAREA